jgi:cholesterol oxidase
MELKNGLRFTDAMQGWFALNTTDASYTEASYEGQANGSLIKCVVTITFDDVDELARNNATGATATGTVEAPALSDRPMRVDGTFRLFVPEKTHVETWRMEYSLRVRSQDDRTFELKGHKTLHNNNPGIDAWSDTTTMFFDITGDAEGKGIMRVGATDLLRTLATMRGLGDSGTRRVRAVRRYLQIWARRLVHIYGGILDEDGRFWGTHTARMTHGTDVFQRDARLTLWCDGRQEWHEGEPVGADAWLKLTRFGHGMKGPVMLASGFAMSARSFAMTTNTTNLLEVLVNNGYDVWLFDYRASIDLPSSRTDFTLDDIAQNDWRAAVREVLDRTGAETVQVVAHCVGSMSFLMALGLQLEGVRSAVCSQSTLNPHAPFFIRFKTPASNVLHALGMRTASPDAQLTWRNRILDAALQPVPVPRGERCGSAVCRWINLFYGTTHKHSQLNDATHRAIREVFGVGSMPAIMHIGLMMRRRIAVDHTGRDVYHENPVGFRVPIHFLVGEHNFIFRPDGIGTTIAWLREQHPDVEYTSTLLPEYAHLDCFIGRDAAIDVFPVIVRELDRYNEVLDLPIEHLVDELSEQAEPSDSSAQAPTQ